MRILRYLLALVTIFAVCLAVLIGAILVEPRILLNPATLGTAARFAERSGISVKWKSVEVDPRAVGFLRYTILLHFSDLCYRQGDPAVMACFDSFDTHFTVLLSRWRAPLEEVRVLQALGGTVEARLTSAEKNGTAVPSRKDKSNDAEPFGLPDWLARVKLGELRIKVNEANVLADKERWKGAIDLRGGQAPGGLAWELESSIPDRGMEAHLEILSPTRSWLGPWRGRLRGKYAVGPKEFLDVDLRADQRGNERAALDLQASYRQGKMLWKGNVKGEATAASARFRVNARGSGLGNVVSSLDARDCALELDRQETGNLPLRVRTDCPLGLTLADRKFSEIAALEPPRNPKFHLKLDAETVFPPSPDAPVQGNAEVRLLRTTTEVFDGEARVAVTFGGAPAEFPRKWEIQGNADALVRVPDFQRAVGSLEKTPYAVPAPLNVLKGNVGLVVSGEATLREGAVPMVFTTRLSSASQTLQVDANGTLDRFHAPRLSLRLLLSDVQLVLPRLRLQEPPRFLPDPRIKSRLAQKEARPTEGNGFEYDIEIVTPPDVPVRFISNLAKRPVPVFVYLRMRSGQETEGSVKVARFPLELFRRDASVEHIRLQFEPSGATLLDGAISFKYIDYSVRMLLLGTAEEPVVRLISEPPLPERQLLAVLLFGRPLEELDPDQSESVGSTRAAITDGAVGLASLYLLASTPIESVGYDPNTQRFSAKVRLSEGTSLNVGTERGELAEIGIRKRISRFWTITTNLGAQAEEREGLTAWLEWSSRY